MFRSRFSDIVEPRDLIKKDSRSIRQFKISCQKIEIIALIVDLLLLVLTASFGSAVYRHVWPENFATGEACLAAGIVNGFLYSYAVRLRGLYPLPVLLMPLQYFGRLITIFVFMSFFMIGSVFLLKGNVEVSPWPLVATLSL